MGECVLVGCEGSVFFRWPPIHKYRSASGEARNELLRAEYAVINVVVGGGIVFSVYTEDAATGPSAVVVVKASAGEILYIGNFLFHHQFPSEKKS